jgi:peptidoglycan pentaglycine glycine transferase (the first glycine)
MTIIEVSNSDGWNAYIAASLYGDVLQSWEWGEVKLGELWGAHRIRVSDDSGVLGQAQVLTRKMPMGMVLYYVPRGPVLDYAADTSAEVLQMIINWIREHALKHRGLMIKIGPAVVEAFIPQSVEQLKELGFKPSFRSVQMRHTRIVDLQPNEVDILNAFDKDTRNLVRRAAKEGVTVEAFTGADDVKAVRTFHNMYMTTSERAQFAPRPWDQFQRMWKIMAPIGMAKVYLARSDDQVMAGNVVLMLGQRANQLWAASRRDTHKKFATYALQWAAMQDLKAQGMTHYDMWGIAASNDPTHPWAGLSLFKKGFSGKRVDYIGDYDLPISSTYPLFTMADKMRQRMFGQHG